MPPNGPGPVIPQLPLHKKKRKRRSKSPGLICCCRFVRREKISNSPIYTARELSVASLPFSPIGPSQQRPLTKTNGKDQIRIEMPKFADDTPSNTADYLDCGRRGNEVEEGDLGRLETARTSRIEDLKDYQPMERLVAEILSEGGEAPGQRGHKMQRILFSRRQSAQLERLRRAPMPQQGERLASEFQSASPSPAVPFPPLPSPDCPQLPLAIPPSPGTNWRLAISSLPQSVCQICWVAYVWMASSLAFLLDRLL